MHLPPPAHPHPLPHHQAVIHCEIVRQAARVVAMDRERLRSGDRAAVRFRFLQRPEYLTPGTRFVFRWVGRVGVGWGGVGGRGGLWESGAADTWMPAWRDQQVISLPTAAPGRPQGGPDQGHRNGGGH